MDCITVCLPSNNKVIKTKSRQWNSLSSTAKRGSGTAPNLQTLSTVLNSLSAIRPKRTNGSTMKPYAAGSASANVPCNHTEIREKSLSQWLDTSAIIRRATSQSYWMQTMNEIKHRTNYGREWNHYTARPSNADVCTVDGGNIEETEALLFYSPSNVRRRGLPHWRGGL